MVLAHELPRPARCGRRLDVPARRRHDYLFDLSSDEQESAAEWLLVGNGHRRRHAFNKVSFRFRWLGRLRSSESGPFT